MKHRDFRPWITAALLLAAFAPAASPGGEPTAPPEREGWSEDLDLLATAGERELYSRLAGEAERALFLQQFWHARDPFLDTPRNELREAWESRLAEAGRRWHGLADERARVFLLRGEPSAAFSAPCPRSSSLEVWTYEPGFRVDQRMVLAFLVDAGGRARLWRPGSAPDALAAALPSCACPEDLAREVRWIRAVGGDRYRALVAAGLAPPRAREWVATFRPMPAVPAGDRDGSPAPAPLAADLGVELAGVADGKAVVRVEVLVSPESLASPARPAAPAGAPGAAGREFSVAGQVWRGGEPFETFLYRLHGRPSAGAVALVFERRLAPGDYRLRLDVEHLASGRRLAAERQVSVPPMPALQRAAAAGKPAPALAASSARRAPAFPAAGSPLAEADAALSVSRPRLRLLAPPGRLLTGRVGIPVRVEQGPETPPAERIERVSFTLDGKSLFTRNHPPFDLVLDLGPTPRPRRLCAQGVAGGGEVVARGELLLNGGAQGVEVQLVEPRPGRRYRHSLRAVAEVTPPPDAAVERVELWFGEERFATLYQPPYSQPFVLPREEEVGTVRAVAYLAGGGSSEGVVLVNGPEDADEIEVRMVELYATVEDGQGRQVLGGLAPGDFVVLEDGVRQQIRELEPATDAPLSAVLLLDSSESMQEEMQATRQAALGFLARLLRPQDQAAVVAFQNVPQVRVPLTGDAGKLEQGIGQILAEGGTALYDSLIYSLLYLSGVSGQRAVLLLSDGEDTFSRLTFAQAEEVARRTGIAIYVIGLGVTDGPLGEASPRLKRLAAATGGRSFFIRKVDQLAAVYAQIERELRGQYKIAYQSSNPSTDDTFRKVQVRLTQGGLEARTISGYYP